VALSTLRNYPEAEQAFRAAIEIDPNLFEARYFYGRACLAHGKFREAIAPLQAAGRLRADDYQAPALLGMAYTGLGRRKAAARAYAQAVEVARQHLSANPGDVRALYLGAGALARLGKKKTALAWAARALNLDGKDSAVLYNVGCLYAILGRSAEALGCLKRVVRSGWRKEWIKHDPDLAALRGLREFTALIS
jgi:adenylate cyclase